LRACPALSAGSDEAAAAAGLSVAGDGDTTGATLGVTDVVAGVADDGGAVDGRIPPIDLAGAVVKGAGVPEAVPAAAAPAVCVTAGAAPAAAVPAGAWAAPGVAPRGSAPAAGGVDGSKRLPVLER
jgi:hypothetical protein